MMDSLGGIGAHWWWLLGAALLAIFELFVPGVFLVWMAAAAALTGLTVALIPIPLAAQIGLFACGYNDDIWRVCLRIDPEEFFADAQATLSPMAENMIVLANPVQPHSEGEIVLASSDPLAPPEIRMDYYSDPHDMAVMLATYRRALDIVAQLRETHGIGEPLVPPAIAARHGHAPGDAVDDALIEDLARHYSMSVYHLTSTCRIGSVVDPELRVLGVTGLRVADASVMPNVVSGNTNAASIMIGEKAAELVARAHGVRLEEFVG